jgi:hypothetical protein
MIWPFKRKPTVRDRRVANDFRAGDKVQCISANWNEKAPFDPQVGDVLTVMNVTDEVNHCGVRCYWLWFKLTGSTGYNSQAFRKLVDTDDAATIARIKGLKSPTPETADA